MVSSLEEIKSRKRRRKKDLEKALEEIKKQLITMGAIKIILFGSLAKNNIRSWSDLDILCVMPATKTGKKWQRVQVMNVLNC